MEQRRFAVKRILLVCLCAPSLGVGERGFVQALFAGFEFVSLLFAIE
jgi:hypothetical protein